MNVGELKKSMEKAKVKDSDDVAVVCERKRHTPRYVKRNTYPLRDGKFTSKIFEIVC